MHSLSLTQRHTLAQAIADDSGVILDYFSFIEIALSMFEDISGFETKPPGLDLLNDLWGIYCSLAS